MNIPLEERTGSSLAIGNFQLTSWRRTTRKKHKKIAQGMEKRMMEFCRFLFLLSPLFCLCLISSSTVVVNALALNKLPPHAGYHGTGANPQKPFFEGWYMRLTKEKNCE